MTDLDAARTGDHAAFARLIAPFRTELRAHCYRMSGRLHDADDLLQESFLRAWRGLAGFEQRASLRTWLYKVATHTCLDKLATPGERAHVEPCPPELYADAEASPDAQIGRRESVALAFVVALQALTAQQRAVLLLRDVLGMSAAECAELLDLSTAAINSTLVRARDAVGAARDPAPAVDRAVLARYIAAWERADASALISLLRDDARLAMPPIPGEYHGATAIAGAIDGMVFAPAGAGAFRFVELEASGAIAFAMYARREDGGWHAQALHTFEGSGDRIAAITAFMDPSLFARFGLPPSQ